MELVFMLVLIFVGAWLFHRGYKDGWEDGHYHAVFLEGRNRVEKKDV